MWPNQQKYKKGKIQQSETYVISDISEKIANWIQQHVTNLFVSGNAVLNFSIFIFQTSANAIRSDIQIWESPDLLFTDSVRNQSFFNNCLLKSYFAKKSDAKWKKCAGRILT